MLLDDIDIGKIEGRAEATGQDNKVTELQRQLDEKNQKIESLEGQVRKLEVKARIAEHGREIPPPGP